MSIIAQEMLDYNYIAFGLKITSDIEIPVFLENSVCEGALDIVIRSGKVPEELEDASIVRRFCQMKGDSFLCIIPDVARYLVEDGRFITVEALGNPDNPSIVLYLTCSVFGALFHQKGLLALHSSVVKVGDSCVLFCGKSQAGKSTLARAFLERGYTLQGDDLGVVWPDKYNDRGLPLVYPAYPSMKLWDDALSNFGEQSSTLVQLKADMKKFSVPMNESFNTEPLALSKVYVLKYADVDQPILSAVDGGDKLRVLTRQTYRTEYLQGLGVLNGHFKMIASVADRVEVARLYRPEGLDRMDEIMDFLERDFKSLH